MQADLADVRAESPRTVVVLAVDVVSDSPADSDKASAGRDGKEPPFREEYIDDVGEAHAAFAAQHPRGFIETQEAVEAPAVDQFATGVETRIAVAASQAIGKQGARCGSLENVRHLVV